MKRKCEFFYIDGGKRECDFCDEQKICATIFWMDSAMIVCKDCLQEFANKFNDTEE